MSAPATPRRSIGFLIAYALASAGGVIAYLPLLTLLLPMKIERIAGAARIDLLTVTLVAGSLTAGLSNILFGWLSDRTVAAGGGRRAWVAGGMAATVAAYGGIAAAASPIAIVVAVVLFQAAVNVALGPMLAIMAEEVPDAQKGVTGGLLLIGNPLAAIVSTTLVAAAALGETVRLLAVPLIAAMCAAPLLLWRARPLPTTGSRPGPAAMVRRDLLIAWGGRLLVQVAGNVLSLYLLYYLESIAPAMPQQQVAEGAGRLLAVAYVVPMPIAIVMGRMSDRTGRRKPFLIGAAAVAAAGVLGMAEARSWGAGALAFGLYACGSSVFLAVHAAFAMQLLPDARHRARDLGLLNLANTLAGLAGPLLAWSLATPHDFRGVMTVLAAVTLAGGLVSLAARGQR